MMIDYLKMFAEETPDWLKNYNVGDAIDMQEVLNSRILFYPGSGNDGQPIRTFNQSQCVHVFFYVDYGISRQSLENVLESHGFLGYHRIDRVDISKQQLIPNGWIPAPIEKKKPPRYWFVEENEVPYCFVDIYERDDNYDDSHGSDRFAVIFLFADAIAAYDAIFCNNRNKPPFILVLQDHGFGGEYDSYGEKGAMKGYADFSQVYPDILLAADHTPVWSDYELAQDVPSVIGGINHNIRRLYIKKGALFKNKKLIELIERL